MQSLDCMAKGRYKLCWQLGVRDVEPLPENDHGTCNREYYWRIDAGSTSGGPTNLFGLLRIRAQ